MTSRLKRAPRRRRFNYPPLSQVFRGQACDIERPVCGVNRGLPTMDPNTLKLVPGRVSRGTFIFERELPRPSRNRYDPQVEDRKHGRRQ